MNFLIGNEDMHLKNFSLITHDDKVGLSPAYDIINTTLALMDPQEEIALPVKGKKSKLNRSLLIDYFGRDRLGLTEQAVTKVLEQISSAFLLWPGLINRSFLSPELKEAFLKLVDARKTEIFPP